LGLPLRKAARSRGMPLLAQETSLLAQGTPLLGERPMPKLFRDRKSERPNDPLWPGHGPLAGWVEME